MDPKRRLPVLKMPDEGQDEGPARPPWQWVGFGALAIVIVWVPLVVLAGMAAALGGASQTPTRVVLASALALGAVPGGYLVGRWGPRGVGLREAALGGLAASLVAFGLSLGGPGALAGGLLTIAVTVPFAALGGRLGLKRRSR